MIGLLPEDVLEAVLETIPIECSVIDGSDRVLAWNKHETRIFKRPKGVIGRDVRQCYPKGSLDKVEQLLQEMEQGSRDRARFWIDLAIRPGEEKHKVLIEYYALRDRQGRYIGCLEATQDISDLQAITGEKRLLD